MNRVSMAHELTSVARLLTANTPVFEIQKDVLVFWRGEVKGQTRLVREAIELELKRLLPSETFITTVSVKMGKESEKNKRGRVPCKVIVSVSLRVSKDDIAGKIPDNL